MCSENPRQISWDCQNYFFLPETSLKTIKTTIKGCTGVDFKATLSLTKFHIEGVLLNSVPLCVLLGWMIIHGIDG